MANTGLVLRASLFSSLGLLAWGGHSFISPNPDSLSSWQEAKASTPTKPRNSNGASQNTHSTTKKALAPNSPTVNPAHLKADSIENLSTNLSTRETFADAAFLEDPILSEIKEPTKYNYSQNRTPPTHSQVVAQESHPSSSTVVSQIQSERSNESAQAPVYTSSFSEYRLPKDAYRVLSFKAGFNDDGLTRIDPPKNINFSIQGPDYDFKKVDYTNESEMAALKATILSLGHRGEITLKVSSDGWIEDRKGPDFVIFENPMRYGNQIWQEFAHVGVSYSGDKNSYLWFDCNQKKEVLKGCAGVVPRDEGGDAFDLATLGINRIRYIKIRDTGYNLSTDGLNVQGFDLDALELIHAYTH